MIAKKMTHRRQRGDVFGTKRRRCVRFEDLEDRRLLSAGAVDPFAEPTADDLRVQQLLRRAAEDYVPGEVLVKLRPAARDNWSVASSASEPTTSDPAEVQELDAKSGSGSLIPDDAAAKSDAVRPLDRLTAALQVQSIERVFQQTKHKALLDGSYAAAAVGSPSEDDPPAADLSRWYRLTLPDGSDVASSVELLEGDAEVEVAEPVFQRRLTDIIPYPIEGIPDHTTDPGYSQQWFHAAAKVPNGWNYLRLNGVHPGGKHDVVVAVIDSGVDYTDPELIANIWTNAAEIPANGIDDDSNGFVDDVHGASVVSDGRSHSGDPIDLHGHGTHVAGIIAAQGYNNMGGVGVAFNVQVMPIRAAQYSGVLTTTDITEAILYAVDNGADVINMSFGGYQRSQIEADALAVALSQAMLVAAAGNDGVKAPMYPAAFPYVIGVMAAAWFSNYGPWYEAVAPGESIYSTLPGNQYASWSGTSMAAPMVSGAAALMRSYFFERAVYSSRLLMGALGGALDVYRSLTTPPKPGVSLLETWLFDTAGIDPGNDGDGRIDSGETVHIGVEVINRAGPANLVISTLEARAPGAVMDDPYVSIDVPVVDFGNMGPFAIKDNGFIYNSEGVITGVTQPFVVTVDPNTPNDHVINFVMTTHFLNGWDPEDTGVYYRVDQFQYIVQRGKNIPTVISEDLVLTKEDYWIAGGPVLIEPAATLTIREGTQVQWGAVSDDPYNPGPQNGNMVVRGRLRVEGTADEPVNFFPSDLVGSQTVSIQVDGGIADMSYVRVRNPYLRLFRDIDHAYFAWDRYSSEVSARSISRSIFHKFRGGGSIAAEVFDTVLFDSGHIAPYTAPGAPWLRRLTNSTFLLDNENVRPITLSFQPTIDRETRLIYADNYAGKTYALLGVPCRMTNAGLFNLEWAVPFAEFFGGYPMVVSDQDELNFLNTFWQLRRNDFGASCVGGYDNPLFVIGMTDDAAAPGTLRWINGEPVTVTNWRPGQPAPTSGNGTLVHFTRLDQQWATFESHRLGEWVPPYVYFVVELPGTLTDADFQAVNGSTALLNYVRANLDGPMKYNAFLNPYWDPNITHWMRFVPKSGSYSDWYATMVDNYWGTDSTTLIDHAIVDYYDNFTSARIDYGTPPAVGFESTYPFVQAVTINGLPAHTVPSIGGGIVTFTVTFNRDMDTSVDPFVTFGPSAPFTDFLVRRRGGWLDARTWEGEALVTPLTGDGYQLMRVSGAVAADDPWLVTGEDSGRIRFLVQTVTTAALGLQASGVEGGIRLSWTQDDFDLLAGYNLYRSNSVDGPYERINQTIIPVGQESYLDMDVPPATPRYYKFTVVQTDLQESMFSNVASAAAVDTVPPAIVHVPPASAAPGFGLRLEAQATDNVGVTSVTAYYRAAGSGAPFATLAMANITGNDWSATIPGSLVQAPGIEYYLVASDGISQVFSGTPSAPHTTVVQSQPTLTSVAPSEGSASGGTVVTLGGTLFQTGASVLFGGLPASNVQVIGANQIAATTPPHFPAIVDVQVVNPDDTAATLLNGFRYVDSGIVVSLPTLAADFGSMVDVPVSVANVSGLRAADLTIEFDAAVLAARSVRNGSLAAGWAMSANTTVAGRVLLSLASATAASGTGPLAVVTFEVIGPPPAQSPLTMTSASLNDGAVMATISNGLLTVNGLFGLSGMVSYFGGGPVPGTSLSLVGVGAHAGATDADGRFALTDVPTGTYTLTPAKADDVREITAFDASLVLQSSAGLLELSPHQRIAADVNRNGNVTALDAAYILEASVALLAPPFPGAGLVWAFDPTDRRYALLNGDRTAEDFTAVLLGDVSGNWTAAAGGPTAPGVPANSIASAESLGVATPNAKVSSQDLAVSAAEPATASLAIASIDKGSGQQVVVPIELELGGSDIYAADLVVTYDPSVLSIVPDKVVPGSAAAGMSIAVNAQVAGVIRVGVASAQPFSQNGELLQLWFNIAGDVSSPTTIAFQSAKLNEGAVPVSLEDGAVQNNPPKIVRVLVGSTSWSQEFRDFIDPDGGRGYTIGTGPDQLATLPWGNIDQIFIQFSEEIGTTFDPNSIALAGVDTPDYAGLIATVSYDTGTHIGTVNLNKPIPNDKLLLVVRDVVRDAAGNALDGEWTDGESSGPSGNGSPGGDFLFRFNLLAGDTNRSGGVAVSDVGRLRLALGSKVGDREYSIFADLNGSGGISVGDIGPLRSNLGRGLPTSQPAAPAPLPQFLPAVPAEAVDRVLITFVADEDGDEDTRIDSALPVLRRRWPLRARPKAGAARTVFI